MTFDYRDVLLKAASRVEQEGMWYQGDYWPDATHNKPFTDQVREAASKNRPACAVGTIEIVAAELGVDDPGGPVDAIYALREAVYLASGDCDIAAWNDTPGRTAFEVAEAMRKAAE